MYWANPDTDTHTNAYTNTDTIVYWITNREVQRIWRAALFGRSAVLFERPTALLF